MEKTAIEKLHLPVMVKEAAEMLNLANCQVVVDGTLGLGGYTEAILKMAPENLKVIAFDLDEKNLELAKERLADFGDRVLYFNRNYADLSEVLNELQYSEIDGIVLDLGIASTQVDEAEKGFSFNKPGPLDMRFSKKQRLTAAEVVNKYSEKELARIFYEFGDEKQSRKIARLIFEQRQKRPFETTTDLAELIAQAIVLKNKRLHPATKVFQALRIEVNGELNNLVSVLNQSIKVLKSGGRIVIIAYHSAEDRIVKNFFRETSKEFVNLPNELTTTELKPVLKIITKKPLTPQSTELEKNPRARSAVMRVAEKL